MGFFCMLLEGDRAERDRVKSLMVEVLGVIQKPDDASCAKARGEALTSLLMWTDSQQSRNVV